MEELENALVELFNASPIPFEAKRYVVLKFARDVEDAYQHAKKQIKERTANDVGGADGENR